MMTVSEKQKKALVNLLSVNKLGKEICDELNYRYKTMPVKERLQHRLIKMEDEVVLKYAKPIPPSEYPDSISKREPDKTQTIHCIRVGSKILRIYYDGEEREYWYDVW